MADAHAYHPSRWRRLLRALAYLVAWTLPVAVLALLVRERVDQLVGFDEGIIRHATDFTRSHEGLRQALLVWQEVSQPRYVYVVGTLVALWVWIRHHLTTRALWGFVTMMIGWNLALDVKAIVQRARPVVQDPVSHAPGYSFPSGHAANAAIGATAIMVLLWPTLTKAWRGLLLALVVVFTLVTGVDRVLLGVHYPTDVLAGFVLGTGMVLASYAGYRGWNPSPPKEG